MIIMVFKLKYGIAFILGLSIIFYTVYSLEITTGYFRVNTRSKELNSCAVKLLKKPGHGVRVSQESDKCEETASDDPKKVGYIYAETNVFEKKFTKPVNIFEPIFWENVKGIGQGFRFDLFLSSPSGELSEINNAISVKFENSSHALNVDFFSSMDGENVQISEYEQQSDDASRIVHKELSTEKPAINILKLSILAQGDSLKVILDNKEVFTQRLQIINTNSLQKFSVNIFHKPIGTTMLLFHGYCLNIE